MRKQIVPRVLVIALFLFTSPAAFANDDTAGLPETEESQAGVTTRGSAAQAGPTNASDSRAMQAAVEKAADICEETADEAAAKCTDQGISPVKASGSGLGSSDQSASLTRMTAEIQDRIKECSPYASRCKAQCANLSSQMRSQCPSCNFNSMTQASNACGAANRTLANLRKQKDSFVADNKRTTEHGKLTGEASPEVTGRTRGNESAANTPRSEPRDVNETGSISPKPGDATRTADSGLDRGGSRHTPDTTTRTARADRTPASERADQTPVQTASRGRDANHDGVPDRLDHDKNGIPDKLDKNGDGVLDSKQMKTASVGDKTPNKEPAHMERPEDQKPPQTSPTPSDDGKAERRAARRAARQQNEMQQQMQTSMMAQSLQQMGARVQQQQTQLATQQKRAVSAQQQQALLAATIAQQNAMAATLAAQQAARAPASVGGGQGSFGLAGALPKRAALTPTMQVVNAVTERVVGNGAPASTGGVRTGGGAEWTPTGAPVALTASAPYDPRAHTNATQLNQRPFGAEEGGGAAAAAGSRSKSRKRADGTNVAAEDLETEVRTVAGMGAGEMGIQSSAVDIWGLVSQRFQAHCNAGRLKDCR